MTFTFFTTALTMYALAGDDFRVILTEKPADGFFNTMVVVCLVVFGLEILLSCIAKKDYFLGFYFVLDTIATATLLFDLAPVADVIANASNDASSTTSTSSNLRSARSARIGARAARMVRVVRLVRILKLYKAYYEKRAAMEARQKGISPGGEDDWADEEIEEEQQVNRESRVGKRLSEMTTRRVVCLILALLMVLPMLRTESVNQTPVSPSYGADIVSQAFKTWQSGMQPRAVFDKALLQYVYYHNWFASERSDLFCPSGSCVNEFYGALFWMGVESRSFDLTLNLTKKLQLSPTTVSAWSASSSTVVGTLLDYGTMPPEAEAMLSSPWDTVCDEDGMYKRGFSLLSQSIGGLVGRTVRCPEDLRSQESNLYSSSLATLEELQTYQIVFYFDVRSFQKTDAGWNLGVTGFVMVLLVAGSLMFTYDANRLVLTPVEKMIQRVEAIREDPLVAMKMADDEFRAEEVAKAKLQRERRERLKKMVKAIVMCEYCDRSSKEIMETVILEKTIIKLGSLLVLGFGEAGAQIIGQNMSGSDTAGINAMVAGRRVECIIGIVRVRDFSTATEVLQSKIMTFGNQIAEIVHGVCNEFHGAPNKNNGDQFMIIWRVEEAEPGWTRRLAEMSLVACATILGALHRSPLLASYRGHPGLQNRLGSHCRVNLSCGLHKGWAIEGAVGSEFKIDASYLSPNVSIATTLERATDLYGITIMAAQSVVELCSKPLKSKCRLIDRVLITGSTTPMELYCIDLDYMNVRIDDARPLQVSWNTRQRFKVRQFLEAEKSTMRREEFDVNKVFEADPAIVAMRKRFSVEFFQLFNMGYQNYNQGEWQVARRMLSCTRSLLGVEDGPSSALLRFMEVPHQFMAPKDWQGIRELKLHHGLEKRTSFGRDQATGAAVA